MATIKKLHWENLLNGFLLVVPLCLAMFAYYHFYKSSTKQVRELVQKSGEVAGESVTSKVNDLSNEIPIIPNSEISSLDKSNGQVSLTLTSDQPTEEIKQFYEDYFYTTGWSQQDQKTYQKENRTIEIEIGDKIIKIKLSQKT